ncbi:Uncharacterised protein [uncultured archaeon]|nr:Uncharacterised protein [uncultured archaeon]
MGLIASLSSRSVSPAFSTQKTSGVKPSTCWLSLWKLLSGMSAGNHAGLWPVLSSSFSYIVYIFFMVITDHGMKTTKPLTLYLRSHNFASLVSSVYHSEKFSFLFCMWK